MDIRDRAIRCFQSVFPDLSAEQAAGASPETVAAWDSLANFSLLVVIEEEFGLQIPPEDLPRLRSFTSVAEYVAGRTAP